MTELAAAARSLVVEREMPHPPQKIWRALTQGPLIEQWLMQNDFQPVTGHRFNFRTDPMPQWNGVVDCEVLEIIPHQRLTYSWNASGDQAPDGLRTIVCWTLTPCDNGTRSAWSSLASGRRTKPAVAAWARAGRAFWQDSRKLVRNHDDTPRASRNVKMADQNRKNAVR